MKTIFFAVLIGTAFCASAQLVTNEPSRLQNKITYTEGKIGSETVSIARNFAPVFSGDEGVLTCSQPGNEHALKCAFVGRNGDKDVWRITVTRMAMTKDGHPFQTTTSKEAEFNGKKIIVFEDALYSVVMESLNAEDLKKVQSH